MCLAGLNPSTPVDESWLLKYHFATYSYEIGFATVFKKESIIDRDKILTKENPCLGCFGHTDQLEGLANTFANFNVELVRVKTCRV